MTSARIARLRPEVDRSACNIAANSTASDSHINRPWRSHVRAHQRIVRNDREDRGNGQRGEQPGEQQTIGFTRSRRSVINAGKAIKAPARSRSDFSSSKT
jgi:hypothetical protein